MWRRGTKEKKERPLAVNVERDAPHERGLSPLSMTNFTSRERQSSPFGVETCKGSPVLTRRGDDDGVQLSPANSDAGAPTPTEQAASQNSSPAPSVDNERPHTSPNLLPNTFSRADLRPKGLNRLVIHPDSKIKSWYESLIVVCVLYTAVIEPFEITYMTDIVTALTQPARP